MAKAEENLVRVNLILPESERDAFDALARGEKPRLSVTDALRELMRAAVTGRITIDRAHALKFSRKRNMFKSPRRKS